MTLPIFLTPFGPLDADTFYMQRDSRTTISGTPSAEFPVAFVLPLEQENSISAHVMLLWAASMTRRMGKAFARTIIVASSDALARPFLGFPRQSEGLTLQQALEYELRGADPFGPIEFRASTPSALEDVKFSLCVGTVKEISTLPSATSVTICAHGWVASVIPTQLETVPTSGFDAAAAAAVFAAALGVAEVYRAAHLETQPELSPPQIPLWIALDTGEVTGDSDIGAGWLLNGGSRSETLFWKPNMSNQAPAVRNLLLVSAGGLGMNLAQILSESHLSIDHIEIVDPDTLEISNLNRLIGVHVSDVGNNKALLGVRPFILKGFEAKPIATSYEEWRSSGNCTRFESPLDAMVVGVDQAETRLEVASDWPSLLVNGATAGKGWIVSAHRPGLNGCLGCFYGSARPSYNQRRQVIACAGAGGGLATTQIAPEPMASYPHVSVAAAAMMAGVLTHALWDTMRGDESLSGQVRQLNTAVPSFARVHTQSPVDACDLLCGQPYLQSFFASRRSLPTEKL